MTDGKYVFTGHEELLKPVISLFMSLNEMLEDKDVGEIMCDTLPIAVRGKRMPKIILACHWQNAPRPPYKPINGKRTRIVCSVPMVDRKKLEYERIVRAMGGENGYTWGHWKATAEMSEGNGKMTVFASTKSGAIDRLEAMADLSSLDILSLVATEELAKGVRTKSSDMWKDATKVFPSYCTIINQELIAFNDRKKGVQTLDGDFSRKKSKLWLHFKPSDWDKQIVELLKKSSIGDDN